MDESRRKNNLSYDAEIVVKNILRTVLAENAKKLHFCLTLLGHICDSWHDLK